MAQYMINVADYGVLGDGTDETTTIQSAITAALAQGSRYLYFPYGSTGVYNAPTLTNWWDLIFVGDGTLTGLSGKAIHRQSLPLHPEMWNSVRPHHLKQTMKAAASGAIKVVIVGDSHSLMGAVIGGDANRPSAGSVVGGIKERLSLAYPDSSISFVEIIATGRPSSDFEDTNGPKAGSPASTADSPPGWWTIGSWESYVAAENPDLVLFFLGGVDALDGTIDTYNWMDSAITTMQAYAKRPDIILQANILPASHSSGAYGTDAKQRLAIQTMETIRLLARVRDLGLIDLHAMTSIKRDGFNPREIYHFKTKEAFSASYALQSTSWTPTVDVNVANCSVRFKVDDMANLTEAPWVHVKLGGAAGDKLLLSRTRAQLWTEKPLNTPVKLAEFTFPVQLAGMSVEVWVSRIGSVVQLGFKGETSTYANDIAWTYYNYTARLPGDYTPTIKEEGTSTNPITISSIGYWYSQYQQYMPSMLDKEVWGTAISGAESGGDGNIHYSGQAVAEIAVPVIDAINWRPDYLLDGLETSNVNGPEIINAAGSAATPNILADKSDPDTGIYSISPNILGISAGGVEQIRFGSNGVKVGAPPGGLNGSGTLNADLYHNGVGLGSVVFSVYASVGQTNATGAGATAIVNLDTEVFDIGADFASNTFTAPVTGKYLLVGNVRANGVTTAAKNYTIGIFTSNRTYNRFGSKIGDMDTTMNKHISVIADMDANDTAKLTFRMNGEATNVVDINGGSDMRTSFYGYLLA